MPEESTLPGDPTEEIEGEPTLEADGATAMEDAAMAFMERRSGAVEPLVSTGLAELDRAILGVRRKLYVCAGRPGMGKSSLLGGFRRALNDQDKVFLDFNLEMDRNEMCERELAYRADLNLRRIMQPHGTTDDEARLVVEAAHRGEYSNWRIYDDCFSISDIEAACEAERKKAERLGKTIGGIGIDYLQLMGGGENRVNSITEITRKCKLLQKRMKCGLFLLSQLNRSCDYRDNKRPVLADLRDSGSIEQDADCVIFTYRDQYYNPMSPPHEAELIVGKQRSGPTGTVRVGWRGRTTSFYDLPIVVNSRTEGEVN